MENNEQVIETPVAASTEPSLADYRASREPAAGTDRAGAEDKKPAASGRAASTAPPVEPGDPVVDDPTEDETDTPVERKKKLGGFQKTIAKQAAELDELKRKLGEKPGEAAAPAAATTPAAAAATEVTYPVAKPKLEDCDSIEDFTEKLSDWKHDERDWKRASKDGIAAAQTVLQTRADNWNASVTAFKAEHDDYDARMAAVAEIKLSRPQQEVLLDSPHGVALAYELADDPDELARLIKLPPLAFARAIGKLEAAFPEAGDAAEEKPIKVSAAPPPFRSVNGAANRGVPNPATLSFADYRKARESGRIH
jgi:hypothetical protein